MAVRRGLALVSLSVFAVSSTAVADGPSRPVGEYGGRWVGSRDIVVLDVSVPALLRIDRTTLARSERVLSGADSVLDPYGLALPGDGTAWILADKGRFLFRFSESTGDRVEKRRLEEPCQGIATFWDRVGFVAVRLRPNEPLLVREEGRRLRPLTTIVSRAAADPIASLIANLLRCGSGKAGAIPCWFVAGPPEVLLVSRSGNLRALDVPSFAVSSRAVPSPSNPGAAFVYPVRDALLADEGLWILSNQEGDRTPLEEGALRGRHVVLVRDGRPGRVLALDREARAILDADARGIVVLFADGSIERVGRR